MDCKTCKYKIMCSRLVSHCDVLTDWKLEENEANIQILAGIWKDGFNYAIQQMRKILPESINLVEMEWRDEK